MLALLAIAAGMLWNAGLGVYHSGVEWNWWPGPQDCSGALPNFSAGGGLLEQMQTDARGALRRGGVALPRPFARRLQRADLAGARRARARWGALAQAARARDQGSSSVSQ